LPFPSDDPGYPGNAFPLEPFDASFAPPPRPRKFQSRLWLHALLLLLTIASTTTAGALHYASFISEFSARPVVWQWGLLLQGFWYSGTLLGILGAHEMGHYLLCRRYDVDASLPYFIPMPPPPLFFLTGTLGAVIRIREAFPSRKVLFDIGVAGPIAGFVVLVPALFYGMTLSNVVPEPTQGTLLFLGEPLLLKLATYAIIGPVRDGYTVNIHPMVFAAWFGILATAINLLPFGQLDGGHITYATLGRWSTPISVATVGTTIAMTVFVTINWLLMSLIMIVMLFMLGPRHPRVLYEHEPLGLGRNLIAIFALIMFILCFTPVPIQFQDLVGGR
jgi:membrane-associated protease RseP (regulator of RpoE activity)